MRAVYREYKDIEATLESHCLKLTLNLWEFFSEVPKCVVQAIIQWFSVYDWNCISGKVEYAFNQCKESARQTKSELDNIDASCGSSPLCPYKKEIVEEEYYATCQNILQMYLPNLSVDCKKNSTSSRLSKKVWILTDYRLLDLKTKIKNIIIII